jgi:formamidopyrimidine-DNA glycosylase
MAFALPGLAYLLATASAVRVLERSPPRLRRGTLSTASTVLSRAMERTAPKLRRGARAFSRGSVRMMPEGPEVKHLAASIDSVVGGGRYALTDASIVSGRYVEGAKPKGWEQLTARLPLQIEACSSRGKFMFWLLEDGCSLWSTLGLTGWWSADPTRDHTRAVLSARAIDTPSAGQPLVDRSLAYADVRNFGTLRFSTERAELDAKLSALGVPWLDGECDWPTFRAIVDTTVRRYPDRPVAVLLMDQSKTAGIGNYILSEALYRAGVYPFARCADLDIDGAWAALHRAIFDVMSESYDAQGANWHSRFELQVYSKRVDPEGRAVLRAEGPHKRAVWYVPERQLIGKCRL